MARRRVAKKQIGREIILMRLAKELGGEDSEWIEIIIIINSRVHIYIYYLYVCTIVIYCLRKENGSRFYVPYIYV